MFAGPAPGREEIDYLGAAASATTWPSACIHIIDASVALISAAGGITGQVLHAQFGIAAQVGIVGVVVNPLIFLLSPRYLIQIVISKRHVVMHGGVRPGLVHTLQLAQRRGVVA